MALLRYLIRDRNGTYYFRRPIPERLREYIAAPYTHKANWKTTLGTKDPQEARANYAKNQHQCEQDFQTAELREQLSNRKELSTEDIKSLAEWYRDTHLIEDDDFRTRGYLEDEAFYEDVKKQGIEQGLKLKSPWMKHKNRESLSDRQVSRKISTSALVSNAVQKAIARGDTSWIANEVEESLSQFGVKLDRNSPSFRALCLAFLEASGEASDALLRRYHGEVVKSPHNVPLPTGDGRLPSEFTRAQVGGITISDAYKHWLGVSNPKPRSAEEFERATRLFVELRGDLPISALVLADGVAFRDALARLPIMRFRVGALRYAPLPQMLEWAAANPNAKRLAAGSVNKSIRALATICKLARDDGMIPAQVWENPFKVRKIAERGEPRLEYNSDDLRKIFNSSIYCDGKRPRGGAGEAAFWMPLLALFHGSRESELGQLLVNDVRCENGIWHYVVITDDGSGLEPGKTVKVVGKRLRVPIHSMVLKCGFLDFWRQCEKEHGPNARLFDELKADSKNRLATNWAKWWGRWVRESLEIKDKRKVFHSFRHGWKDAARAAGVSEELSDAITGHSGGGQGRRYGQRGGAAFKLEDLQAAVESVRFSVDLSHLHQNRIDPIKSQ